MVNYKDLGLVNTREIETKSPVIMQVSKGARNYANATILRYMAEGAVAYAKELGCEKPEIVLHLDHGDSFELCKDCIDMGFSSVMYDGSSLPYEENIKISRQVVEYAHKYVPTSSSPSSAHATRRPASSFRRHSHSTCWQRSRKSSPDSPSCSTVLLLFLRTRLTPSTSMAASCPMQ